MIIDRYIQRSIYLGTLGALLLLVSLSLFFVFVRELDDIGKGDYGMIQAMEFVLYSIPGKVTEFLPLAVLLGCMLSLGALAANSEIIAMQASGMSLRRFILAIMQAAAVIAVIGFLLSDWIVPDSEARAQNVRSLTDDRNTVLQLERGLWIKDESRVLQIGTLMPDGYARDINIYELDRQGGIVATTSAASAVPVDGGWQLQQVSRSLTGATGEAPAYQESMRYPGSLSVELLQVLKIKPRKMSSSDLRAYLRFLEDNGLVSHNERMILWKKISSPTTIFIMCLLSIPFVLGSQRLSGSGQRLLVGIVLGLAYVVTDRLLTQLGSHLEIQPVLVAMLPNLIFSILAAYLLLRKMSHRSGAAAGIRSVTRG